MISSEVEKQANSALDSGSRRGSANETGRPQCDKLSRTGAAIIEGSSPSLTANFHSSVPCHQARGDSERVGYSKPIPALSLVSLLSGHRIAAPRPPLKAQANRPRWTTYPELPKASSALSHHLSQV